MTGTVVASAVVVVRSASVAVDGGVGHAGGDVVDVVVGAVVVVDVPSGVGGGSVVVDTSAVTGVVELTVADGPGSAGGAGSGTDRNCGRYR
ncbi:MAG: hypothetical protein ABW122_06940, partial [Ilumatobacteraceae bacterium]